MLFNWLFRRPTAESGTPPAPAYAVGRRPHASPEALRATNIEDVVYPPQDPGLPVEAADVLLSDQAELMRMLQLHAAASPARYEERFTQPLRRVAEYVNLLPGSATSAFSGVGGLFRASCETAFSAFRASDGRIFTGEMGVEDRHKLEGRWRYVCFLAGMLYPLGASLAAMSVINTRGARWSSELDPIADWASRTNSDRVYVTWLDPRATPGPSPLTGTLALRIVGRENIEWLNEGSPQLIASMIDIVTDAPAAKRLIAGSVVKDMWSAVREREQGRRTQNYGQLSIGSDIAPYLLDALVALARSSWKMNKSVIYADAAGVYIQWPRAATEIIDYCRKQGYPGVPATDTALLSIMVSTRIVIAEFDGVALMQIADQHGEVTSAVKLTKPAVVLGIDETLESVAANRPVAMSAVRAADPLSPKGTQQSSGNRNGSEPQQPVARPVVAMPRAENQKSAAVQAAPTLDLLDPLEVLNPQEDVNSEEVETDSAPSVAANDSPAPNPSSPPNSASPPVQSPHSGAASAKPTKPAGQKGKGLVEGAEVRFADFLPPDVKDSLPNYYGEVLGRLVHTWRNKANGEWLMRMCENGAAFEVKLLGEFTKDVPAFLSALGERGLLFTSPSTPSKMIYPVPLTEGGQKSATCFILAHHALRRLAL